HGHDIDYCRELKRQTEEAYRSGKLAHLVKGIRKGKAKASDTQQGNWKKSDKYNNFSEASILMIRQSYPKRKFVKQEVHGVKETTFPPVIDKAPSTDPVLKPSIRVQRVDSNIPLIGFSREYSWPLGEVPLEIILGEENCSRKETLNFVIVSVLKLQCWKSQRRLKKVKESSPEPSNVIFKSKRRLQELLRVNANIFAWTYADMTRVPTTLVIDGNPFGTEHKLNEYNHIEPVEQKRRGLAPELTYIYIRK
ncbi:hypothetical protein Tco_1511962, partial [Tanacetum coccineum]